MPAAESLTDTLAPAAPPIPFSTLWPLAAKAALALRRLVVIDDLFADGCESLTEVAEKAELLPDGFTLGTARKLPRDPDLNRLLARSFGRPVDLFRPRAYKNGPFPGLSDDGRAAARMARAFLAEFDAALG